MGKGTIIVPYILLWIAVCFPATVSQCTLPTNISIVPLPSTCTTSSLSSSSEPQFYTLAPSLSFTGPGSNVPTLQSAWNRFKSYTFPQYRSGNSNKGNTGCPFISSILITTIYVNVTNTTEIFPQLNDDESYGVNVPTDTDTIYVSCPRIGGCLHGLTTLSQLIKYNYSNGGCYTIMGLFTVMDTPRFTHRGLMLDTARHYYPVSTLFTLIDTMALAKLNVFHWHIVDDQSFPLVIPTSPSLAMNGAFDALSMYSTGDVQDIVEYARERGIRVIPEIDVPGHSASWCQAYPDICISCNTGSASFTVDPSQNQTYTVINQILQTLRTLFMDNMLHLGGDEIDLHCWINNPFLLRWLQNKYPDLPPIMAAAQEAYGNFIPRVQSLALQANYTLDNLIHWEDAFDFASPNCGNCTPFLSNQTIIQVFRAGWGPDAPNKGFCGKNTTYTTIQATDTGYRVIWMPPSSWYLSCYADHCDTDGGGGGFEDWLTIYSSDPYDSIIDPQDQQRILGGEVTVWSERLDPASMLAVAFPRAGVAAERLWSPMNTTDPIDAAVRFTAYQKFLLLRGLSVSSLGGGNEATTWGLPSRPPGPGL